MDILIKNMEMPKDGCKDCRFHNYSILRTENKYLHLCYAQCLAEKTETKEVVKLHENCPLIPVPEHGRLVDLDAFLKAYENMSDWEEYLVKEIEEYFKTCPVVLERTT